MRKLTILLLCCGLMFCSACNKAEHSYIENHSAVSETTATKKVIEIPTEEEKEAVSTENTPPKSNTTVINEQPKEETKITNTPSNTSSTKIAVRLHRSPQALRCHSNLHPQPHRWLG